jgi:hypothetical protein
MHRNALRLLATMLVVLGLLTLGVAPAAAQDEPLTVELTFDQATIDPRTGEVTLSGTVTCSEPASVNVVVYLRQEAGPTLTAEILFQRGEGCPGPEGSTFSWTIEFAAGRFHPGPALVSAFVRACVLEAPIGCVKFFQGGFDMTIRLAPAT